MFGSPNSQSILRIVNHACFRPKSGLKCNPCSQQRVYSCINLLARPIMIQAQPVHPAFAFHRKNRRLFFPPRYFSSSYTKLNHPQTETETTPAFTYPPDQLLQSLEMTANVKLPPIPASEDKEVFWRAYLLANQIILYLGARPPAEAEAFSSAFQAGTVSPESEIARGRAAMTKITEMLIETTTYLSPESTLRSEHPEVLKSFENIKFLLESYKVKTGQEADLERWSRFFIGLRTEVVELAMRLRDVVEKDQKP
ncbi:hypothetical protein E1B28_009455 [Marasmius oreades]|uniref:Uncharacterized protein n=1 Tax=Marasmius oreades TaxID=181124 RepID=A0A9P7UQR5_9AGAR|nr:uncharacterized protein E1B28_009455 [Marasmius oreades]KAG7090335.1 hypothetical protein E1B28_009455 [Marasmius oreades]